MTLITFGELFCGPGGIGLGAKQAKLITADDIYEIDHQWAIDSDIDSCRTFQHNISPDEPHKVICADIREFDITKLSPVNGFAFGFPCNDFSIVGEKKGLNGKYGSLFSYGVKIIQHLEPDWFLAENVSGLKSDNQGKTFSQMLEILSNAGSGYRLTTHLYRFEEYGVPQCRHRIVIVGFKKSLDKIFRVPMPTHNNSFMSVESALCNPPIPANAPNHEYTRQSPIVVERLKYIKQGENAWSANIPSHLQLNVKKARMSQIYRRLVPNKPAYTITGSGGGGTHVYHWEEPRALTNRERARLQTFPDDFIFFGSKESVRKQIGMAVPPKAVQIIITAILKTLAGVSYPYVEPKWKDIFSEDGSFQLSLSLDNP